MSVAAADAEGTLIIGAPRSGTTLLRRLVDAHPNIACPGETNVFTACGRFLRSDRIAEGVRIGVVDGLGYAGFTRDDVLDRVRQLAFSFHRDYAYKQGKPRWAAKAAFDAFYLDEIEELCGDHLAFICIQRHGLDVCCSMRELCDKNGGYLMELHEYVRRYPMVLEAFAHAWVDLTKSIHAFAARHPETAIMIKYEDLVLDPDATMTRIMSFLGETWNPALIGTALRMRDNPGLGDWKTYARDVIDQASVGRWKQLSRDTSGRLAAICNPSLALCAYEQLEVSSEHSAEESHRRHQIGLLLQGLQKKPGDGSGNQSSGR